LNAPLPSIHAVGRIAPRRSTTCSGSSAKDGEASDEMADIAAMFEPLRPRPLDRRRSRRAASAAAVGGD
jgi:hypothetical protein